jgi:hypothetical protein
MQKEGDAILNTVRNGGRALEIKWLDNDATTRVSITDIYVVEVIELVDSEPAQTVTPEVKKEFTFAIKPVDGGFVLESNNGGGYVIEGKPLPIYAGGSPYKKFATESEARKYLQKKGMVEEVNEAEAEEEITSPTDAELEAAARAGAEVSRVSRNLADPSTKGAVPIAYLSDGKEISIPLWTKEDSNRAADAVNEAEIQSLYTPFDSSKLRMPTAKQLGVGVRYFHTKPNGWTNGHIIDLEQIPPFLQKASIKEYGDKGPEIIKVEAVDSIKDKFGNNKIEVTPKAHHDYMADGYSKNTNGEKIKNSNRIILINETEKIAIAVESKYFAYFYKTYKGAEFFAKDDGDGVSVKKGGKVVGILMTFRGGREALLKRAIKANEPVQAVNTSSTENSTSPIAIVDAAYQFANATDTFKKWIAESVNAANYSPFLTAKAMDMAAKANGASIMWGEFGGNTLDGAVTQSAKAEVTGFAKRYGLKIDAKIKNAILISNPKNDWGEVFDSWDEARKFFNKALNSHHDNGVKWVFDSAMSEDFETTDEFVSSPNQATLFDSAGGFKAGDSVLDSQGNRHTVAAQYGAKVFVKENTGSHTGNWFHQNNLRPAFN